MHKLQMLIDYQMSAYSLRDLI